MPGNAPRTAMRKTSSGKAARNSTKTTDIAVTIISGSASSEQDVFFSVSASRPIPGTWRSRPTRRRSTAGVPPARWRRRGPRTSGGKKCFTIRMSMLLMMTCPTKKTMACTASRQRCGRDRLQPGRAAPGAPSGRQVGKDDRTRNCCHRAQNAEAHLDQHDARRRT